MFLKQPHGGKLIVLHVHMFDDIIVTRDDLIETQLLKEKLSSVFEMKDLG